MARGRGRGRGRTSSRERGQAPGPASTRAVTPPPNEEVLREGGEGMMNKCRMMNYPLTYPRDD